jgi:hypothetical protein
VPESHRLRDLPRRFMWAGTLPASGSKRTTVTFR